MPRDHAASIELLSASLPDEAPLSAAGPAPPETGLWWCRADEPFADAARWSRPVQIMAAEDRGWHAGPWKPCLRHGEADPQRLFVFFDGQYEVPGRPGFPFVFTLGCLELDRPA